MEKTTSSTSTTTTAQLASTNTNVGKDLLEVLLRTMDNPPTSDAYTHACLSPDHRYISMLSRESSCLRLIALSDYNYKYGCKTVNGLNLKIDGDDATLTWVRQAHTPKRSMRTLIAVSSSRLAFLRFPSKKTQLQQLSNSGDDSEEQHIKRIVSKTDSVDINLIKCDVDLSLTLSMQWNNEAEEEVQNRYYESTDPDECVGFLYDMGDPKGLFLPKSIKTKRLLGVWSWTTGYITAIYSMCTDYDDGSDSADDEEDVVKSIVVSVLQVTDKKVTLVRFFIVKIVSDDDDEEEEEDEEEDDEEKEKVDPIRCVTCTDWALFILSGSHSVHIIDCRTASEISSVACGPGVYKKLVVSPDLRYMTLVKSVPDDQGVTIIDLEKLFRATSSSPALSSPTSIIHASSSLMFTKHVELTANTDGSDANGADSIPALFASLSREPDVPPSDAGLSWHELIASFGGVPVPEMSRPRGITSVTHKGLLKGLGSIPAAPSGFSLGKKASSKRNYHSIQQKQRIAHWKICVEPPEGTSFPTNPESDDVSAAASNSYCYDDGNESMFATPEFVVWMRRCDTSSGASSSSSSFSTEVWIYVRTKGWAPLLYKFECNPLVINGGGVWYFIEQRGLSVLIAGQSEQQVVNNLTLFDLADKADELCRENAWDSRARRLNTLGTGLRYKQLDVAEHALNSLDRDQHVAGLRLLLDHIKAFSGVPAEEPFNMHLIHLGIRFTTAQAISPKVSAGVPVTDPEMQELTGLLKEFRTLASIYAIRWRNSGGNTRAQKRQAHVQKQASTLQQLRQQAQQSAAAQRRGKIETICKALRPEDLFNPVDTDRWRRMGEVAILREGLLGKHAGAAIGFLRMTRPEAVKQATSASSPAASAFTTEWTKLLAAKLAYQFGCDGNYAGAANILDEAGVPSDCALSELLWNTSRRELRNGLMDFLRGRAGAGAPLPPRPFAEYAALVERLYSSASLGDEYERLTAGDPAAAAAAAAAVPIKTQHTTARTTDDQPIGELCPDLDDLTASVCSKYGFSLAKDTGSSASDGGGPGHEGHGIIPITPSLPPASAPSVTAGYARFSLRQLAAWSKMSRERIFVENGFELARRDPRAFASYVLSHNDAGLVALWVKFFLDPVLGNDSSRDALRVNAPERAFANTAALAGLSPAPLRNTCAFIREMIADELAKRGIYLDEEIRLLDAPETRKSAEIFPLVRRVAQGGRLFLPSPSSPEAFDASTLRLLSDLECYPAMMRYYEQHALATLPHEVVVANNSTAAPTWSDFILCVLGGLAGCQGDIAKYDASLAKAAAINANLLSKEEGEDLVKHPLLALALARYGELPGGIEAAAAAVPKDLFPTLSQAALAPSSPFAGAYDNTGIRDDPNDIYSSNADTNLISLLRCPALRSICRKVYSATSPASFAATDDLASERFRYALGVSYFLMRGCPLQAKEWAVLGKLPKEEAEQLVYELCCKSSQAAPSHLLVGASAAFLELWDIDSAVLRADAAAIAALAPKYPDQNVAELVLSAHNDRRSGSSSNARSVQISKMLEALDPEADALLFAFCSAHGLPPPYGVLERLAAEGNWKEFLAFSRAEGLEPQKVLQIVRASWNGQSVKEHLSHAFAAAAGDVPDYKAAQKLACSNGGAAIANFLRAVEAVERYDLDSEHVGSNAAVPKESFVLPLPLVFASRDGRDGEAHAIAYMRHKVSSLPRDCTLSEAVVHLIVRGRTWELGCALCTFLTGSQAPLLAVYEFFHSLAMRIVPSADQLRTFIAEDSTGNLQRMVISAALGLVDAYASSGDERALDILLGALGDSGLGVSEKSPELASCRTNFAVLRDSGLPLSLLRESPEKIVCELAARPGQYDRALALAASAGVSAYPVHIARAAEMVALHRRQETIWVDATVRMELWRYIHQYFVDNVGAEKAAREAAGDFFLDKVTDEKSGDKVAKEHLELLSLAFIWYINRQNDISIGSDNQVDRIEEAFDLSSSSLAADEVCKSVEFVKDLEARVTLLKVCINAGIPVSSAADVSSGDTSTLSLAVNYLINANRVGSARSLAQRFSFESPSLAAAERMARIAAGGAEEGGKPVSVLLTELIEGNRDIEQYGKRVLTDYQAAETLNESYATISGASSSDVSKILARIALTHNSKGNELSRNFISSHGLDKQLVAETLASHFVLWLKETSAANDGELLRNIVISEWPRETLVCYASLSGDVHTVATRVFHELTSPEAPLKSDVETELIISSWTLFDHVGSSTGRQSVIAHTVEALPRFIEGDEFYLLRRILTGTCAFRELYPLIDALYAADQFEVLLIGKARGDPSEDVIGSALLQYMALRHPDDPDRYQQVCLRFGFFNEIGHRLETVATEKLAGVVAVLKSAQREDPSALNEAMAGISDAIQNLLLAADHYTMSQSSQSTRRCFNLAILATLQARRPETLVLGLTRDEARRVMAQQPVLRDAMAVANVYGLQEEWIRPVYAQVVISGNFAYLDEFCYSYNVQPSMWWDISRMYEMDLLKARNSGHQQGVSEAVKAKNMKALLTRIGDYFLQYDIAKKLKFEDISSRLSATVPGIRCFRK